MLTIKTMVPIYTSIPPASCRYSSTGNDIGAEYLYNCVESWRRSGFKSFSVNSSAESVTDILKEVGVTGLQVPRDARQRYGKPTVYLEDFLSSACLGYNGPVAIVNADIVLALSDADQLEIKNLQPGFGIVERRVDILNQDQRTGSEYLVGYDFFVFHSQDLLKVKSRFMAIGFPWWDHFLPIVMLTAGLKLMRITPNSVLHLVHEDRWDSSTWQLIGRQFINEVKHCRGSYSVDYLEAVKAVQQYNTLIKRYGTRIKIQLTMDKIAGRLPIQALNALSDYNISYIENHRPI